jgi:transcriptional regulator with XRE-family HTH domain
MSRTRNSRTPRAVVHKRILEVAADDPDASMAEIADGVTGATTDLVERVLDEYGDPGTAEKPTESEQSGQPTDADDPQPVDADNSQATTTEETEQAMSETETNANGADTDVPITRADLTEKQHRLLEEIAERPEATQQELAGQFDVTRATISRWVSDVDGFEWERRSELLERIFDDESVVAQDDVTEKGTDDGKTNGTKTEAATAGGPATAETLERLAQKVDALENRVDDQADALAERDGDAGADTSGHSGGWLDAELAQKVIHACMRDDAITEAEERRLLEAILDGPEHTGE